MSVRYTALVLAGTRPGGDPLAGYAGVTHKALIEVDGQPMLARVLAALAATPQVARIVVAIDRAEILAGLAPVGVPVEAMPAAAGPSASVALALEREGTPLLVTTADHALLQAEWVSEFLRLAADAPADAVVALARSEAVLAAAPGTQRTWLRFADGDYSGCNLFLLRTADALRIVQLWQSLEAARKRPMTLLRRLGFLQVLRYRLGLLSLPQALDRLGRIAGAGLRHAVLTDGRAAIDVDKPADLDLVRQLVRRGAS
jgi:GTP:adenosylcobinamide-phosphate guanylyltransferase